MVRLFDELVSNLYRQTEVEVEYARLTHVLELRTSLTDFGLLEASCISVQPSAWFPSEDSKGSMADLALPTELRSRHAHVRVVSEASLAENRKISFFPSLLIDSITDALSFFSHYYFNYV